MLFHSFMGWRSEVLVSNTYFGSLKAILNENKCEEKQKKQTKQKKSVEESKKVQILSFVLPPALLCSTVSLCSDRSIKVNARVFDL